MKVRYIRVSSKDQNEDRQRKGEFDKVYVDKVSGGIPFDKRPLGGQLMDDARDGLIKEVHVKDVARFGRDLLDILQTLKIFHELGVCLVLDIGGRSIVDGKENPFFKVFISMLGCIAENEKRTINENQAEGIKLAQAEGRYLDRKTRDVESSEDFKAKYRREIKHILKNMSLSLRDLSKLTGVSVNTVIKIKKAIDIDTNEDI